MAQASAPSSSKNATGNVHEPVKVIELSAQEDPFALADTLETAFVNTLASPAASWREYFSNPCKFAYQFGCYNGNMGAIGVVLSQPHRKGKDKSDYRLPYSTVLKEGTSAYALTAMDSDGKTLYTQRSNVPDLPRPGFVVVCDSNHEPFHCNGMEDGSMAIENDYERSLEASSDGVLRYRVTIRNKASNRAVTQEVEQFASFDTPELFCMRNRITTDQPVTQDAPLYIRNGLEATCNNAHEAYNPFEQNYTVPGRIPPRAFGPKDQGITVNLTTKHYDQTDVLDDPYERIAVKTAAVYDYVIAKRLRFFVEEEGSGKPASRREIHPQQIRTEQSSHFDPQREIYQTYRLDALAPGQSLIVEERAAVISSRDVDPATGKPYTDIASAAESMASEETSYEAAQAAHCERYRRQLSQFRLQVSGGSTAKQMQSMLDYNDRIFIGHATDHSESIGVAVGAKGMNSDKYEDHKFWEGPLLGAKVWAFLRPPVARAEGKFWRRGVENAREYATSQGKEGICYAWQTNAAAGYGNQKYKINPNDGSVNIDHSENAKHNNMAVAYGSYQDYLVSGDKDELKENMPMLIGIARYLASCTFVGEDGLRHTAGLNGPDEFKEGVPTRGLVGLPDSFYNNYMIQWLIFTLFGRTDKAEDARHALLYQFEGEERTQILSDAGMTEEQVPELRQIAMDLYFSVTDEDKVVPRFNAFGEQIGTVSVAAGQIEQYAGVTDATAFIDLASFQRWQQFANEQIEAENQQLPQGTKPTPLINIPFSADGQNIPRFDRATKLKRRTLPIGMAKHFYAEEIESGRYSIDEQRGVVLDDQGHAVQDSPDYWAPLKQPDASKVVSNFAIADILNNMNASRVAEEKGLDVDSDMLIRLARFESENCTKGSNLAPVDMALGAARIAVDAMAKGDVALAERYLDEAYENFVEVGGMDMEDNQGNADLGLHAGSLMAVKLILMSFLGLEVTDDGKLNVNPLIPKQLGAIALSVNYRGCLIFLRGQNGRLEIRVDSPADGVPFQLMAFGQPVEILTGRSFQLTQS